MLRLSDQYLHVLYIVQNVDWRASLFYQSQKQFFLQTTTKHNKKQHNTTKNNKKQTQTKQFLSFFSQFQIQKYNFQSHLIEKMKKITQWKDIEQYHSKCVCQTCTCHKHKCPHTESHIPTNEISSYQNDYHEHPINTWQKPPPESPRPYQPYGSISSAYQSQYPSHKPAMREKLKPRVKDENKSIGFDAHSEYKKEFGRKCVSRDQIKIKDRIWTPDLTPFLSSTTYGAHFPRKVPNKHDKKQTVECSFPEGYGFNGQTTYGNSFTQKPLQRAQSYKPEERVAPKGSHELSSIYRDDFSQKPLPEPCPITKMPARSNKISYPHQHLVYNKHLMRWTEK